RGAACSAARAGGRRLTLVAPSSTMRPTSAPPPGAGNAMPTAPPDRYEPPQVPVAPVRPSDRAFAPLPRPLTCLVDRECERAAVAALLRDPGVRLLTLTGPGGVGKTRVAIAAAAAAAAAGAFPGGLAYVRLALLADPGLVGAAIARALGLRDTGAEPPE